MVEFFFVQIQVNNVMNCMMYMMVQFFCMMQCVQCQVNFEKMFLIFEQFCSQNEEYVMFNGIYQDVMMQNILVQVSDDVVYELLGKLVDDVGLELNQELVKVNVSKVDLVKELVQVVELMVEEEDVLQQRLRVLWVQIFGKGSGWEGNDEYEIMK